MSLAMLMVHVYTYDMHKLKKYWRKQTVMEPILSHFKLKKATLVDSGTFKHVFYFVFTYKLYNKLVMFKCLK